MALSYRLLLNGKECVGMIGFDHLGAVYSREAGLGMATGRRQYQPLVIHKVWEAASVSPFATWAKDNEARDYAPAKNSIVIEVTELGQRYTLSGCSVAAYQPFDVLSDTDIATAKAKGIANASNSTAGELLTVRFQSLLTESFAVPIVDTPRSPWDNFWNFVTNGGR